MNPRKERFMKAIIPIAGVGTRLRPHTHSTPKVLVPVAGKAMLDYIIDDLVEISCDEMIFIIGYLGDKVKEHIKTKYPNVKAEFVVQEEMGGLGHAIWHAKSLAEDDEVLIVLGDTIIKADLDKMVSGKNSKIAVQEVDDPHRFGIVELDGKRIKSFVEKPDNPPSNLAIVGVYYIKEAKQLFDYLQQNVDKDKRTKGEIQLTDALANMLADGIVFETFEVNKWLDCGKKETLLETNRELLKISDTVISKDAKLKDTVIIDHVHIESGAELERCVIGPYVSIGDNCKLNNTIVEDTIICNDAKIQGAVISESIFGNKSSLLIDHDEYNIGDNSELHLS